MEPMKVTDGTIYPNMNIAQLGVGKLEIEAMAYAGGRPVRFWYEITLRDSSQSNTGWGKTIFRGTLGELIALVRRVEGQVEASHGD